MSTWSDEAVAVRERRLGELRERLARQRDVDPDEVVDDWRRHLAEELAASPTPAEVETAVARLAATLPGEPAVTAPVPSQPPRFPTGQVPPAARAVAVASASASAPRVFRALAWFCGVVLPVAALGAELVLSACTDILFDPTPTWWHALLVALVPAANAWALTRREPTPRHLPTALAAASVVAGAYTIVFLPLVPLAVIGILALGIGLLPLAPLLALPATLRALWRVRAGAGRRALLGFALGALALAVLEVPVLVTRLALPLAASSDGEERARGLGWLRWLGSERALLTACADGEGSGLQPWTLARLAGSPESVPRERAREVWFLLHGEPWSSRPAAPFRLGRSRLQELEFDDERGGETVGGLIPRLALREARLDGSVDADAALAYLEWTLVFANDGAIAQEARGEVLLPPGGVVSRLTLWVEGEPREAAFAARASARAAYQQVAVVQRRDPVLVTTRGPDRVLVQCFPVPARGTMKVRLGITAPLVVDADGAAATLAGPRFVERNFATAARSDWWLEAKRPLRAAGLGDGESLRGAIAAARPPLVRVARDPALTEAWTPDGEGAVQQRLTAAPVPRRLVVVVDASAGMARHLSALGSVLAAAPWRGEIALIAAGDAPHVLLPPTAADPATLAAAGRLVAGIGCRGGCDGSAALVQAWDLAADAEGAVLWLVGPQPVVLGGAEALSMRWQRRPGAVGMHVLPVVPGPIRILRDLETRAEVRGVPVGDDPAAALSAWLARAAAGGLEPERRVAGAGTGQRTSDHLVRLQRLDAVRGLLDQDPAGATGLAVANRLVTPVSGAVVLETDAQYRAAGLEPPAPQQTVPAVPEPGLWLLLAVAVAAGWMLWRRPRTA